MNIRRQLSLTAAAGLLTLAVTACSDQSATDQSDIATEPSMAAASDEATMPAGGAEQFLTDAMKGDNSEVKLGQLAADQGSSEGVKGFGQMLVTDHGQAKQDVVSLASTMNVPATDETKPEADAEYTKLQAMTGEDFDKEFVAYMIEDHKKDIAKFQQEADSDDPQPVTDLASKTVPVLQKHLETAQSLQ